MTNDLLKILNENPGGAGGLGHKAASAALAAGYSPSEIASTMAGTGRVAEGSSLMADLSSSAPTSSWGVHGPTTTTDSEGNTTQDWSGVGDARSAHVGAADVNFMRHQGMSETEIQDYMQQGSNTNPDYPSGGNTAYGGMLHSINLGAGLEAAEATNTANTGKINDLTDDYNTLSGNYDTLSGKYDALTADYGTLQADVAQAAKDALKIKYTGSTSVQNPSAMGIQAAQGEAFRGSGLAGTAALARPNKGLKIQTLNV